VRQLGTLLAFEITQGKDEYLNGISAVITEKAMEQGVYIRPLGNTVYIMPPYCITETELAKVYTVLLSILAGITG
jgi:adenosylmethionine-8-amino-7-oxononanoate aminotransferase